MPPGAISWTRNQGEGEVLLLHGAELVVIEIIPKNLLGRPFGPFGLHFYLLQAWALIAAPDLIAGEKICVAGGAASAVPHHVYDCEANQPEA